MTKQVCPACGIEGFLQTRGNSQRIKHYIGFQDGKRIYQYHKLELIGTQQLELNKTVLNSDNKEMADGEGFEPSTLSLEG